MRAIVTGGAGFIGSHLVDSLVGDGWDVTVVDSGINPTSGYRNPDASYIASPVQLTPRPAGGLDAVFHLAGPVGPVGVLSRAGQIVPEVVDSARAVAGWAQRSVCPLVFVSTSEVYGQPTGANSETTPRVFQAGSSARMEYAIGKLAAETMLLNTEDLDVRIVRPFNVSGPRQMPEGGFVLPRMIRQALAGEPLTVYLPGSQRRAMTHVADIVSGIRDVFEKGRSGQSYNLGNPANETTMANLAWMVVDMTGTASPVELVDPVRLHGTSFREAPDKVPDCRKASAELGWVARRDLRTLVRETAEYWRTAVPA